jgi:guanylate kinase
MLLPKRRLLVCGKAGSGKDYLRDKLIENKFKTDVCVTTRPKREGETEGVHYYFVSESQFQTLAKDGKLFDSSNFNGWNYGTLQSSWETCQIFTNNMTPNVLAKLREKDRKESLILYLDIDAKIREERIKKRNDADSAKRRMAADELLFASFSGYDHKITDHNFEVSSILKLLESLRKG